MLHGLITTLLLSLVVTVPSCRYLAGASSEQRRPRSVPPRTREIIPSGEVPYYTYEVVNRYPHDPGAFTQGLVYHAGALFESTGLNGASSLRQVELETGRVLRKVDLPAQYFAEGLALFGGRAIQLTWQTHLGFVYDLRSFAVQQTFSYPGEGWGLTTDGQSLIMSDGTSQIRFLDPQTFQTTRTISVYSEGRPLTLLNELEYIAGEIYANIWQADRIARIDPQSGRVTAWIDLSGLLSPEDRLRPVDVLNGIAYDADNDRLWVTGKLWPRLFQIRLKPR